VETVPRLDRGSNSIIREEKVRDRATGWLAKNRLMGER
jgi:hypothetical protein